MSKRKPLSRALLAFTLLTLLCAGIFTPRVEEVGARPVNSIANHVLISEFRTRGPNGTGENDEFIELHNPTSVAVDISNWELRSSNSSAITTLLAIIPSLPTATIIQPGGYYLIANNNVLNPYSGSTTPDLIYLTDISDDGGIALIDPSNPSNPVDQVGMSVGSLYKEGSILTPLSAAVDQSFERVVVGSGGNCEDDDNNLLDFILNSSTSNPQNALSSITLCAAATATPTSTFTPTNSPTATFTPTLTLTPTPSTPNDFSVLINEVAWGGTSLARKDDQWIELYNTESVDRNLNGWTLTIDTSSAGDGSAESNLVTFGLGDKILAGNFYLLARSDINGNFDIFASTNASEDKGFTTALPTTGSIVLRLRSPQNDVIDTANKGKGSGWYAGTASSTYASMERRSGKLNDDAFRWQTFGGTPFALNRDNASVRGTPKRANSVIANPTATRTRTPAPVSTAVPIVRPIINEFLARPGFDWNQDGSVDVFDEFIEIKNIGVIDVNLGGWKLDDEANLGSNPFTLPSVTLKPGERIVFYGLETNILLSDGGDTVRLLNSSNKIYDSYTYKIAKVEDESVCRLVDGHGDWYEDCTPTPTFTNTREGESPSMPDGSGFESPVCNLPDTLPEAFLIAECRGYGANLWSAVYWDAKGWESDRFVPENMSKWESFVE